MADSRMKLEQRVVTEVPYDDDDDEVALVAAASEPAVDDEDVVDSYDASEDEADPGLSVAGPRGKTEAQVNGVMVLSLLDKIIGAVDQIQQTQSGLEARQEAMEKSVSGIQGELAKLSKSHAGTAGTVDKMLEKVRKVSVNVKTVRSSLEKQAGQIKRLEGNENELLKRRNFKVLIYQDEMKAPKPSKSKPAETAGVGVATEGLEQISEEGAPVNSEDEVEIEEIIEESRAERIKRTSKQRVDTIKKAFSKEKMEETKLKTKEKMEKTKLKTKENLEKTRQRTRDNLEKTKHSLEKKMGKLGSRMTPNLERKEKVKKSLTPDHAVHARSKTAVYRVPPFTFHVKKIREGEVEVVPHTEESEGLPPGEDDQVGLHLEVEEGELVRVDSPEMEALMGVAGDSELVLVETDHLKKNHRE